MKDKDIESWDHADVKLTYMCVYIYIYIYIYM